MKMETKKSDFEAIRFGKITNKVPKGDVLVKFKEKAARNEFYKGRKGIGSSFHNIYINEKLTEYRSGLFYNTSKLVKKNRIQSTWTQECNIMVKTKAKSRPIQITSHDIMI